MQDKRSSDFKLINIFDIVIDLIAILSRFSYCLQAMFIPAAESLDTSYFVSRYVWNPEDENVQGGSDFEDLTDTCSSGSFSNTLDEEVCTRFHLFIYQSPCTKASQWTDYDGSIFRWRL